MRKSAIALTATILASSTSLAMAEEKIGRLVNIDLPRDELTVENVTAKIQGAKIEGDNIAAFKVGDTVKITFDQQLDSFILQTLDKQMATSPR